MRKKLLKLLPYLLLIFISIVGFSACDNHEHTPGEWIIDAEATCQQNGSRHIECIDCHEVIFVDTVEKLAHINSDWIFDKNATCQQQGYKYIQCTKCEEILVEDYTDKTEHIYKNNQCIFCEQYRPTDTTTHSHITIDWTIESLPTCAEYGKKYIECVQCHEILVIEEIPKLPHTNSNWIIDYESTCVKEGKKHIECVDCSTIIKEETISTVEHVRSSWLIDYNSTCREKGSKHIECINCQKVLQTESIPITHKNSGWIIDKNSTCSEFGSKHIECLICEDILIVETIPKLTHESSKEWEVLTYPASCTSPGVRQKVCILCNIPLETQNWLAHRINYNGENYLFEEGETYEYNEVAPLVDSNNIVWSAGIPGNCMGTKYAIFQCDDCLKDIVISSKGAHQYKLYDKIDSFNNQELLRTQCENCLEKKDFECIVIEENPSCIQNGHLIIKYNLDIYNNSYDVTEKVYTGVSPHCLINNGKKIELLEGGRHEYEYLKDFLAQITWSAGNPGSCTDEKYGVFTCSSCNYEIVIISNGPHTYSAEPDKDSDGNIITSPPTETQDGYKAIYTCTACGEKKHVRPEDVIPKLTNND